jgi:hypothetical protein
VGMNHDDAGWCTVASDFERSAAPLVPA